MQWRVSPHDAPRLRTALAHVACRGVLKMRRADGLGNGGPAPSWRFLRVE